MVFPFNALRCSYRFVLPWNCKKNDYLNVFKCVLYGIISIKSRIVSKCEKHYYTYYTINAIVNWCPCENIACRNIQLIDISCQLQYMPYWLHTQYRSKHSPFVVLDNQIRELFYVKPVPNQKWTYIVDSSSQSRLTGMSKQNVWIKSTSSRSI